MNWARPPAMPVSNFICNRFKLMPLTSSMQVRISVVPRTNATATIADRDFLLKIQRGKQVEHVQIRANQPLPEVTFDFDLHEGNVRDYPLDRYVSVMTLAASERGQDGSERPLPIHVTAWEGLFGFDARAKSVATPRPEELQLQEGLCGCRCLP